MDHLNILFSAGSFAFLIILHCYWFVTALLYKYKIGSDVLKYLEVYSEFCQSSKMESCAEIFALTR